MPSESRSRKGWRKTARSSTAPSKRAEFAHVLPAATGGGGFEQARGDDVDRAVHFDGDVLEFGVEGDGDVGRDGPRRGGPDEAVDVAAGERGMDRAGVAGELEAHPDGGTGVVLVLDLGLGQSGAAVEAPVDGLQALVDRTLAEEVDESAGDDGFVLRTHGEVGLIPAAEDAEALEGAALQVDVFLGVFAALGADLRRRSWRPFCAPSRASTLISIGRPWQSQPGM